MAFNQDVRDILKSISEVTSPMQHTGILNEIKAIKPIEVPAEDKEIKDFLELMYDSFHNKYSGSNQQRLDRRPLYKALILQYLKPIDNERAYPLSKEVFDAKQAERAAGHEIQAQRAINAYVAELNASKFADLVLNGGGKRKGKSKSQKKKSKRVRRSKKTRRCPCSI
jgi:hypothetical protein